MPFDNLYLIGLTGNIACGKSTVLDMLHKHGAQVIDADQVTRELQQPGQPVYQQIVAAFGEHILTSPGGPIDRAALAAIVFSEPAKLQQLEQIVHPAVHETIAGWLNKTIQAARSSPQGPHIAVIDAIKLLESGLKSLCNAVWVVICRPEQQLERLIDTRGMSEQEAQRRIAAQQPQSEKIAQADLVIDNSGTLDQTNQQVAQAWQAILAQQQ